MSQDFKEAQERFHESHARSVKQVEERQQPKERTMWQRFRGLNPFFQILIAVFAVGLVVSPFTGDESSAPSTSATEDSSGGGTDVTEAEPEPQSQPEPEPAPQPVGPKATLKSTASEVFSGQTNYGKARLKEAIFTKSPQGWNGMVTFRADDNLTTGFRKTGIENDMRDAYKAFFNGTDVKIKEIVLDAEFPLVDDFGNESDGSVYVTYLTGRTAKKVNWSEADYLDWTRIWTTTVLHPEFRG
jgi:hypothetical protein